MKKPKRIQQRIGMTVAIALSLLVVVGVVPRIFLADSPQPNPNALADLGRLPSEIVAVFRGQPSPKDAQMTAEIPQVVHPSGITYEPLTKGVYASEPDQTGKRYIKIEKGTTLEKKVITLDSGRTVSVYIPVE